MTGVHHFAVYDRRTGEIVRCGSSTDPAAMRIGLRRRIDKVYCGVIDPTTHYLPGGVPTPRAAVAPVVTPDAVKAHAARLLSYTDWYVTRRADTGDAIPDDVSAYRQAVREASGAVEAMTPIPSDFHDPKYWPEQHDVS